MTLTSFEHTMIGALGGCCEVSVMQPLVGLKNAMQEGRPIPTNVIHLYRGLGMNIASMAPITATQFGTNRIVQQLMAGNDELTGAQRVGAALIAGGTSAFVAAPSEMIIILQQKSGRSLAAETSHFLSNHGFFAIRRGLLPCILREAPYAAGYLGVCPAVQNYLDTNHKGLPSGASMVIAGLTGGTFGAVVSQPFDTMKTRMQAFMYTKPEYLTLRSTMSTIYKEGGLLRFWRGLLPRMTRIIGATFILNYVRTNSISYLEGQKQAESRTEGTSVVAST